MFRFTVVLAAVLAIAVAAFGQAQAPRPPQAPPLEERVTALEKDVQMLKELAGLKATKPAVVQSAAVVPPTAAPVPTYRLVGNTLVPVQSVRGDDFIIDDQPAPAPGPSPFIPDGGGCVNGVCRSGPVQFVQPATNHGFRPIRNLVQAIRDR